MKSGKVGRLKSIFIFLIVAALSTILSAPLDAATGNIHTTDKYAWSEIAGWNNFRPPHGGVTVYPSIRTTSKAMPGAIWRDESTSTKKLI